MDNGNMLNSEKLAQFKQMLDSAKAIAFFGGAGVSTESGIPDFRSVDGLYNQTYKYPPETILSHTFYLQRPEDFFEFYRDKMLCLDAKPNAAHIALAKLEQQGRLTGVITQNIDGLHQAAGSKKVFELHGSVHRNYCQKCHKLFDAAYIAASKGIPVCDECGGRVKPDVVLYEEGLDSQVMEGAVRALAQADLLIIGGTSLAVYPAAGLVRYCEGKIVLINKTPTPMDNQADLVLDFPIGQALGALMTG